MTCLHCEVGFSSRRGSRGNGNLAYTDVFITGNAFLWWHKAGSIMILVDMVILVAIEMKDDHYTSSLIMIDYHCYTSLIIDWSSLLYIIDHDWSSSSSYNMNHEWSSLIIIDHHWSPLLYMIDHDWSSLHNCIPPELMIIPIVNNDYIIINEHLIMVYDWDEAVFLQTVSMLNLLEHTITECAKHVQLFFVSPLWLISIS